MLKLKTGLAMALAILFLFPYILALNAYATVFSAEITVNKVTMRCDIGDSGLIQIHLSDEQSKQILDNAKGSLVFDLSSVKDIKGFNLTFNPRAFENASIESLKIISMTNAEVFLDEKNFAQLADRASEEKITLSAEYFAADTASQSLGGVELNVHLKDGELLDRFDLTNPVKITVPYNNSKSDKANIVAVITGDKEKQICARSLALEKSIMVLAAKPGKYLIIPQEPKSYSDLTYDWMKTPVSFLSSRQVVNGVSEHSFAPNQGITYAEFLTIFVRFLNLPKGTSNNKEIPAWAKDTLSESNAYMITRSNFTKLKFSDRLTRQKMFSIICGYISANDIFYYKTDKPLMFTDIEGASDNVKQALALLTKMGLIQGDSNKKIRLQDTATRAEAAQVIYRFLLWSIDN